MLHDILGRGPRHTWQLNESLGTSKQWIPAIWCDLIPATWFWDSRGTPCALKALRVNGIYLTEGEISASSLGSVPFTTRSQRSRRCLLQPWIFQRMTSGWTVFYFIPFFPTAAFGQTDGQIEPGTKPVNKRYHGALQPIDCCFGQPIRMLTLSSGMDIRGSSLRGLVKRTNRQPWSWFRKIPHL